MQQAKSRNTRGYTLVELLTVLAIVALLAGILMPAFVTARDKARQTVCLSNLRQIGMATLLYAHDFDDEFPFGADMKAAFHNNWVDTPYNEDAQSMRPLPEVLFPYLKTVEVWRCPADTGFTHCGVSDEHEFKASPSAFATFGMSYLYRPLLAFEHRKLSTVVLYETGDSSRQHGSSEISLFMDASGAWHGSREWNPQQGYRFNVLFLDGHAASTPAWRAQEIWSWQTMTH